jgi:4-amino-4-deoxy-L-arabinose transferase-like glycosyltransferase
VATSSLAYVPIDRDLASSRIWLTALALGVASLSIFLWGITKPHYAFYDESQYIDSAHALLAQAPNPNPEAPPLGKLLIAGGITIFGDNPFGWRALGAVFGVLTLVGVYLWSYLLVRDYTLALTAALLTLFNNFLYVMSRVAMMDIFLVAFLIFGLLAFTMVLEVDGLSAARRSIFWLWPERCWVLPAPANGTALTLSASWSSSARCFYSGQSSPKTNKLCATAEISGRWEFSARRYACLWFQSSPMP